MDTHIDHHDRAAPRFGALVVPDMVLCDTQLMAVDFLERCVVDLEPLAALTGDAGTGKTTALDIALSRRDYAGDRVIRARNFAAGPLSLHRALTAALGVADAGALSADQLEPALRRALADAGLASPPVLAVDNAQSLPPETLRYLSLLAGLREAGRPLFRILLVGRPGLALRDATPVRFALQPIHPEEALQVVERRLAAARVRLEIEAVWGVVQDARGNLRRLNTLLRAQIEEAGGNRRGLRAMGARVFGGTRRLLRDGHPPWRATLAAAAALLAISLATAFVAYRTGAPRGAPPRVAAATPSPLAALPALSPPLVQSSPKQVPLAPAAPAAPAAPVAPNRLVLAEPAPAKPQVAAPAPVIEPKPDIPVAVAALPPAPPLAAPSRATRFRVNNISSCHRGVCPRWAVTDLDRKSHFVAAFDPSPLHLDRETLQRLRKGALELTVSGSVRKRGKDGQTLVAETLQSIVPHHVQPQPSPPDQGDPTAAPDRSPPPGFLPIPGAAPAATETPPANVPAEPPADSSTDLGN